MFSCIQLYCTTFKNFFLNIVFLFGSVYFGIILIGGPMGWRAVFPNEKREFCRAAHKIEGRAGGLHKRAVWRAFPQPAHLYVQLTGPPCCATCWPGLLCSPPKIHVIHLETRPSSPPGPPFSVILYFAARMAAAKGLVERSKYK